MKRWVIIVSQFYSGNSIAAKSRITKCQGLPLFFYPWLSIVLYSLHPCFISLVIFLKERVGELFYQVAEVPEVRRSIPWRSSPGLTKDLNVVGCKRGRGGHLRASWLFSQTLAGRKKSACCPRKKGRQLTFFLVEVTCINSFWGQVSNGKDVVMKIVANEGDVSFSSSYGATDHRAHPSTVLAWGGVSSKPQQHGARRGSHWSPRSWLGSSVCSYHFRRQYVYLIYHVNLYVISTRRGGAWCSR